MHVKREWFKFSAKVAFGVSSSMLALGSTAWAQDTSSAPVTQGDSGVQDIVVTAQRFSENAQKAALPIAVVSADSLQSAGVSQPENLNALVPSLKLTNNATTSIYIRGVGENSAQQNSQSAVAVSVDGIYIGRTSAVAGNFYDLQRVEVLKGPQGTLYGRNASGGAINIITNKPTDQFGGSVTGEIGAYGLRRLTGALNVPVTDTLAIRAAFYDSKRNGFLTDGSMDEDIRAARLKLLWTPTSRLTVAVNGDVSRIGGIGIGAAVVGQGLKGFSYSQEAANTRAALGVSTLGEPGKNYVNRSVSAQVDYDFDFATLTLQPGYREQHFTDSFRSSTSSNATYGHSNQFSMEARLSKQTDSMKFVIGGYFFDENVSYNYNISNLQGVVVTSLQNIKAFDTRSIAAFGESTFNITDHLRAIIGGRYTREKRMFDAYVEYYGNSFGFTRNNAINPDTGVALSSTDKVINPINGKSEFAYAYLDEGSPVFRNFSGKVGFEFDIAPRSLLYGTFATGFKSGGFSIAPAPYNVFKPEKLSAFTLGSKNRFFDNMLQLNVEAFYWKYKNQQIAHTGYDVNGAAGFVTDNAGSSKIYGANFDIVLAPTRHDTFAVNFEYLKTKVESYSIIVPQFGPYVPVAPTGCKLYPAGSNPNTGAPLNTQDCSGFPLPFAPKWTGTVSYSHTFDLGERGEVTFLGRAQFATEAYLQFDRTPQSRGPGYISPDFDVTYTTEDKRFSLTAYVRNANDKRIYNTVNTVNNPPFYSIRDPRTYGARATVKF
jgi:iron complex outermembrane receptor protein